jgi:hypothetical protein
MDIRPPDFYGHNKDCAVQFVHLRSEGFLALSSRLRTSAKTVPAKPAKQLNRRSNSPHRRGEALKVDANAWPI